MINWYYKTEIKTSKIHGRGRFAVENISKNASVLTIDGNIYRNENNSYVNHSLSNNIDIDKETKTWYANKDIKYDDEITMNYLQWIKELPF